ncbi:TIR domain-containing protein [Myxococcota bacterium]|nr:TIR domain-containing protein [Myxococcota bacterium]
MPRPLRAVSDAVFGYDVFISYARVDARSYAEALREALARVGLKCFLDHRELAAGEALTPALERGLRRSIALLIVASPRSLDSKYIPLELARFAAMKKGNALIVPVSVGSTLDATPPLHPLRQALGERIWLTEGAPLDAGPSPALLGELSQTFRFTRREATRNRLVLGVAGLVAASSLAALGFGLARSDEQAARARAEQAADRKASEAAAEAKRRRDLQDVAQITQRLDRATRTTEDDPLLAAHDLARAFAISDGLDGADAASIERVARTWRERRCRYRLGGHTNNVVDVDWVGKTLVTAGYDRTARLWQTGTFLPVANLNLDAMPRAITLGRGERVLAFSVESQAAIAFKSLRLGTPERAHVTIASEAADLRANLADDSVLFRAGGNLGRIGRDAMVSTWACPLGRVRDFAIDQDSGTVAALCGASGAASEIHVGATGQGHIGPRRFASAPTGSFAIEFVSVSRKSPFWRPAGPLPEGVVVLTGSVDGTVTLADAAGTGVSVPIGISGVDALRSDGSTVAVATSDGRISILRLGKKLKHDDAPIETGSPIGRMAWDPHGFEPRRLAVVSRGNEQVGRVYEVERRRGAAQSTAESPSGEFKFGLAPGERRAVFAQLDPPNLWIEDWPYADNDIPDEGKVRSCPIDQEPFSLPPLASPDGSFAVSATQRGALSVWSTAGAVCTQVAAFGLGGDPMRALAWSGDGSRLVGVTRAGTPHAFDWKDARLTPASHVPPFERADAVAWVDGARAIAAYHSRRRVLTYWAPESGTSGEVRLPAESGLADEDIVLLVPRPGAAAVTLVGMGGRLVHVDPARSAPAWVQPGTGRPVFSAAWSPDGRVLAAARYDGLLSVYDGLGRVVYVGRQPFEKLSSVSWSDAGDALYLGGIGDDPLIRIPWPSVGQLRAELAEYIGWGAKAGMTPTGI